MSVVLPNDLVFVPLDVLTAEQLNQLQENIKAVANAVPNLPLGSSSIGNSAITTTKIASKAVTTSKIDWSSLPSDNSSPSAQYVKLGNWAFIWGGVSVFLNNSNTGGWGSNTLTLPISVSDYNACGIATTVIDPGSVNSMKVCGEFIAANKINFTVGLGSPADRSTVTVKFIAFGEVS